MSKATILVADDDRAIRTVLKQALERTGYHVVGADTIDALRHLVEDGIGDLLITDVMMPDGSGLDLMPDIKTQRPDLKIIVMSARNTVLTALQAAERGAFDYLPKPFDLKELLAIVERALVCSSASSPTPTTDESESESLPLIGRSMAMQEIYRTLARLMNTDLTVMITGESGTGKELVAKVLHDYGKRQSGPFIAVNMAAIPKDLIESELFGHEKGAFTGAAHRLVGRFEQASGGTLFLDEIGDMPLEAQTRLLRVLQEGEYTTIGGRTPLRADVRIIAATHRDLMHSIRHGQFREDLFYRLNVVPLHLPPLRDRSEDIPELADYFLRASAQDGLALKRIDAQAMDRLMGHSWPGNVREFKNLIRRLVVLHASDIIGPEAIEAELSKIAPSAASPHDHESLSAAVERHLRHYFSAHGDGIPASGVYDLILREIERPLLALTLEVTNGNQIKAAQVLGLNRNTLRKKLRDLDIQFIKTLK